MSSGIQTRLNKKLEMSVEINITDDGYYSEETTGRKIFATLPPDEDPIYHPAYKYDIINVVVAKKEPVIDAETHTIVRDENNNIVYEEVNVTVPDFGWVVDETRYNEISDKYLDIKKSKMIAQSKVNLESFLKSIKLISSVHQGIEKEYSVTTEKQNHLTTMILSNQLATTLGVEDSIRWNATGEECTEWTISELAQLALEMKAFVYPYVSLQQSLEVAIKQASSLDELNNIDISFVEITE